jgi:hypothetical protein
MGPSSYIRRPRVPPDPQRVRPAFGLFTKCWPSIRHDGSSLGHFAEYIFKTGLEISLNGCDYFPRAGFMTFRSWLYPWWTLWYHPHGKLCAVSRVGFDVTPPAEKWDRFHGQQVALIYNFGGSFGVVYFLRVSPLISWDLHLWWGLRKVVRVVKCTRVQFELHVSVLLSRGKVFRCASSSKTARVPKPTRFVPNISSTILNLPMQ